MPNQTRSPQTRRNGNSENGQHVSSRPPRRHESTPRMHPITFCVECQEAIPAKALTCFRCRAKQPHGEDAVQVVFCEKCGHDFPARAMSCHECGHLNPRHPLVRGGSAGH